MSLKHQECVGFVIKAQHLATENSQLVQLP